MKVSAILATYNRANLIAGALKSIQAQSYQNWECLIIDDGSKDETQQISQAWIKRDPRFKYYKRNGKYKKGLSGARNMGLDLAKGDFILFVDDDDFLHPLNFQICLDYLNEKELFFCRYAKKPFFFPQQKFEIPSDELEYHKPMKVNRNQINEIIRGDLAFASCCVMWKVECFEEMGLRFMEDLKYAEEWELFTRIILKGYEGISIDKVLYYNRKHEHSNTGEFQRRDPVRVSSKIIASKRIIRNIPADLMNDRLIQFFISLGFNLQSWDVINLALKKADKNKMEISKYKIGYQFYPFLRPIFKIKGKIIALIRRLKF
jgi:GalNAc5-diNAcBac-PP-undecaprenol beta-1,3-glucosyltransferase